MIPPGLEGSGRDDQASGRAQPLSGFERGEVIQVPRPGHRARSGLRVIGWAGLALTVLAGAEWLREPGATRAALVAVGAGAMLAARDPRESWPASAARMLGLVLVAVLAGGHLRLRDIHRAWPAEASRRERAAAAEVASRLSGQAGRLNRLAGVVASLPFDPAGDPERAFDRLDRLLPSAAPEVALALLDSAGAPLVWAGKHRISPRAGPAELESRSTGYYATLEARRQRSDDRWAVASVLLDADSVVPGKPRTLAAPLERQFGIPIRFLPGAEAGATARWPADGDAVLSIVLDVGPPGAAVERLLARLSRLVGPLLILILLGAVFGAPAPGLRFGGLVVLLVVAIRAPLGPTIGLAAVFSPAVFYSDLLPPVSQSAGLLVLAAGTLFVGAVALWSRKLPARWLLAVPGVALLVATPYLIREIGRGITPPAQGVSLPVWVGWHLALLLPAATLLIIAAAFLRARLPPVRGVWPALLAGLGGAAAAWIGVLVFTGRPGWPEWYTLLWAPPLVLAIWPARRSVTIAGIALVAGAGASLMTWGAVLAGRTDVAMRDIDGLGAEPDPLVEPLLGELGRALIAEPRIGGPTALFERWSESAIARQGYPTELALWTPDGRRLARVRLDALEVPDSLVAVTALEVEGVGAPTVLRGFAMPGIHHLLAAQIDDSLVATVAIGPRTGLIPPAPLGRLLVTGPERTPLYRLSLTPEPGVQQTSTPGRWRREGWALRAWRPVDFAGEVREVIAVIPLGRPAWLLVRGALLALFDAVLVGALWLLAETILGQRRRMMHWPELARSYRARLAVALAFFCIAPAALLVGLSLTQLAAEARQTRDLVLQRILRDASPPRGFPSAPPDLGPILTEQAERVDADLALYYEGRLIGSSERVLEDLGLFPPMLDARAYHAIHLDGDPTATPRNGSAEPPARTGYATVTLRRTRSPAVIATVAAASDRALRERQTDLAFLFLLATIVGVLAALLGARLAARQLARPVTELRDAALAFGAGHDPAPPRRIPPPEFGPVFDAFARMAADVRASQAALEAARRRTDAVLATVATAVVAVDAQGKVLLANRRAEETLDRSLQPGVRFAEALPEPWTPVRTAVAQRLESPGGDHSALEVDAAERRYAVQFAPLGGEVGGLVLAINDVTEATRAARVLAWAEVANQVAHAIKNPLTPLRLGVQHLQRVRATRPAQLEETLKVTGARILAEIERLDAIARAFARFAAPTEPGRPLEIVDLWEVAHEVAELYHLAPEVTVSIDFPRGIRWPARRDELKEVLFNLFENARNAGARRITVQAAPAYIEVRDDGHGIPEDLLPRVFEPRFSTTSSGSGLGLAIVRRLVEGWDATVGIESRVGRGTVVTIRRVETDPGPPTHDSRQDR